MNKSDMAARIKALLSKTTENGCTEAEAMAAAAKAKELMDAYQIDLGEVGMEAEGVEQGRTAHTTYKTMTLRWRLAYRIAEYCDVKSWKDTFRGREAVIIYYGLQSDVDFANWLTESLDAFIRRATIEYMATLRPSDLNYAFKMPRWEAEKAFAMGCLGRINERLAELTKQRRQQQAASTGRSLVVVKKAIVERAFRETGIKLGSGGSGKIGIGDNNSLRAGMAAGDRASFGRPVNGGGGVRLIGR